MVIDPVRYRRVAAGEAANAAGALQPSIALVGVERRPERNLHRVVSSLQNALDDVAAELESAGVGIVVETAAAGAHSKQDRALGGCARRVDLQVRRDVRGARAGDCE